MKDSKTLTNEELSQKVLDELEDIILMVCNNVVEGIDMQLRKGHNFLDSKQKEELVDHLRGKVNLNLTINAGILTKDLASIDIYPRDMLNRGLDSFLPEEDDEENKKVTISANGDEGTTLTMDQFNGLPGLIENDAQKLVDEDEAFIGERKRRSEEGQ